MPRPGTTNDENHPTPPSPVEGEFREEGIFILIIMLSEAYL
jgi:hypothetical protein